MFVEKKPAECGLFFGVAKVQCPSDQEQLSTENFYPEPYYVVAHNIQKRPVVAVLINASSQAIFHRRQFAELG